METKNYNFEVLEAYLETDQGVDSIVSNLEEMRTEYLEQSIYIENGGAKRSLSDNVLKHSDCITGLVKVLKEMKEMKGDEV